MVVACIAAATTPIAGLKLIGDADGNSASLTNMNSVSFVDGSSITGTLQFASAAKVNALGSTQIVVKAALDGFTNSVNSLYPRNNPSNYVDRTGATNGMASSADVSNATNSLMTVSVPAVIVASNTPIVAALSGFTNSVNGKVSNNNGFATNLTMAGITTAIQSNAVVAGSLVVSNGISGSGASLTGLTGSSVVGSVNSSLNSGAPCIYDALGNGIVLTSTNGSQRWSLYLTNRWTISISPAMIADQQFDLALSYNTSNWVVTLPAGTKIQQGVTSLAITNTTGFLDQLSICCVGTNASAGVTTTNAYRSAGTN